MDFFKDLFVLIVVELFFETLCYPVGRAIAQLLLPKIKIDERDRRGKHYRKHGKWRGFTYIKSGERYFHYRGIEVVGAVVIISAAVFAIIFWHEWLVIDQATITSQ